MGSAKLLIVEDEALIAEHLMLLLEKLGYEVLEPCKTYSEGAKVLESSIPDLAILDIQLSGSKSGIDLAHLINKEYQFPFIFLTSNSDPVTLESVKQVQPAALLLKPYSKEELYASIEIALFNFAQERKKAINKENLVIKDALFIKHRNAFQRVNFKDISFIKSSGIYLDIHLVTGKKYTTRSTFAEFANKLEGRFEKTHRSYMVNLDHLNGINSGNLIIGQEEIPISRPFRDKLLQRLEKG